MFSRFRFERIQDMKLAALWENARVCNSCETCNALTWCPAGGEQADQSRAAAADSEGERAGSPNTAGVSKPAGPHAHLLPHRPHRRLSAPAGSAGTLCHSQRTRQKGFDKRRKTHNDGSLLCHDLFNIELKHNTRSCYFPNYYHTSLGCPRISMK